MVCLYLELSKFDTRSEASRLEPPCTDEDVQKNSFSAALFSRFRVPSSESSVTVVQHFERWLFF